METCLDCTNPMCLKRGICEQVKKAKRRTKSSVTPVFIKKNEEIVTPELRKQVFERDGNKCVICTKNKHLTIDHIRPRVKGGSNDIDNLQCMCRRCNLLKGKKLLTNEELKLIVKFENKYRK